MTPWVFVGRFTVGFGGPFLREHFLFSFPEFSKLIRYPRRSMDGVFT